MQQENPPSHSFELPSFHSILIPTIKSSLSTLFTPQAVDILNQYTKLSISPVDLFKQFNLSTGNNDDDKDGRIVYIHNIIEIIKILDVKIGGRNHKLLREIHKEEYEGGFLLWECERDCVQFLAQNPMDMSGLNVLEIGCGSGLLGIKMIQLGAASVTFQDFNVEVLQFWTLPNIILNFGPQVAADKCCFVKGDWGKFELESKSDPINLKYNTAQSKTYDIICGCDIIYETKNYPTLLELFKKVLTPGKGRVVISSKAYYYGNGGSVAAFKEFVNNYAVLQYSLLKNIDTGMGNRREIFMLTFK